jgi:hypothetical protein
MERQVRNLQENWRIGINFIIRARIMPLTPETNGVKNANRELLQIPGRKCLLREKHYDKLTNLESRDRLSVDYLLTIWNKMLSMLVCTETAGDSALSTTHVG